MSSAIGPDLGDSIRDVEHLEDLLSVPSPGVIEALGRLDGDLIVLGASGKMGPSLARMARRASDASGASRRVFGVARLTNPVDAARLQAAGVVPIQADLLDPDQVERLPEASLVVFMAGTKFGTTGQEARTWAINSFLPGLIARKYRESRIVAFSTGNVYGPTPVGRGGSRETDPPDPRGEYAASCLGRERVLEFFSRSAGTAMALIRLNYAAEMRYGVLLDLAVKVAAGAPIDLEMGHFNAIWQGDANANALQALEHVASPPLILNLTGPETLSVRRVAEEFGRRLGMAVSFRGTEKPDALLSHAGRALGLFGPPRVDVSTMIGWVADWVRRGGPTLGKPTHFEVRDGRF